MRRRTDRSSSPSEYLKRAGCALAEALWPTRCAICDLPGSLLCNDCAAKLIFIDATLACPTCGAPYGIIQCSECASTQNIPEEASHVSPFPLRAMASALLLDDRAKRIVTTFKDRNERRLSELMGAVMSRYVDPDWTRGNCALSYVPATKAALRERGFDHTETLALAVARALGIRCMNLFERPATSDQRKLGRKERMRNMRNSFALKECQDLPASVLLIDDVSTTGATMIGAAMALKDAGVDTVYGLTFGKVLC